MDDIFTQVREGNAIHVRVWLDNTENDLNKGDDHRFSLLHWACYEGRGNIVEMLIQRGARINATNMGDDTALHLASSHGHIDIVHVLLQNKANINAINEHGNTPLHYACFYSHDQIAEDLVNNGALVAIANRYDETPLDKAPGYLAKVLSDRAQTMGQDLGKIPFKDCSWLGYKTRSRDATLSRHVGIDLNHLALTGSIASTHSGQPLYKLNSAALPNYMTFFNNHSVNGEIPPCIIKGILEKCGKHPTDAEVQCLINSISLSSTGINAQAFMDYISSYHELRNPDTEYQAAFRIYDVKKEGCLSKDDVTAMFTQMHTDIDVEKLFEEADTDKNGTIDYDEFVALMKK